MSVYENRFKEHQVHDNLQSVHDKIRKLISEATDQEAGTHLNRILSITVFTEKLLKNLDAVFVPKSTLDQLNKILNNINGDLNRDCSIIQF